MFANASFGQSADVNQWNEKLLEAYRNLDNYTAEIVTISKKRGKYNSVGKMVDTLYQVSDTALVYVEGGGFLGFKDRDVLFYNHQDTNNIIKFKRDFIAVNSIYDDWGDYFNNNFLWLRTKFYWLIMGAKNNFSQIDTFYYMGDMLVFTYVDSTISINDIRMYEDVEMYVDKESYILKQVKTKRRNNSMAEFGLGAIEREITINYLEFNNPNSDYKKIFDISLYPHIPKITGKNPYEARGKMDRKERKEIRKQEKLLKTEVNLGDRFYTIDLLDFENNNYKLDEHNGWILIDTWHLACYPCFESMRKLDEREQEFYDRNIKLIYLNVSEIPSEYLKVSCEKRRVNLSNIKFITNAKDREYFNSKIKVYPASFLISPQGKVVWYEVGLQSVDDLLIKIDELMVD